MVKIMAKKMRDMDVRATAVEAVMNALRDGTFMDKAENAGAKTLAYPVELDINGDGSTQEVWVTIEPVCKSWKPYKVNSQSKGVETYPPYDPFEAQAKYERDQEVKRIKAEQKAKEKAEKEAKKKANSNA
jgi:hypothetical protein